MKSLCTCLVAALGLALARPTLATETPPGQAPAAEGNGVAQRPGEPEEPQLPRVHEEITVTASKTPQRQKDVTQTVRTIDAEAIAQLPFGPNRNLSELLSHQPGIFVSPLSRNDANWGSNGGMGPKYSSYLLEGLPIDAFVDG
jgi:outer membrane receptor protein involved in Fe transport